MWPLPALTAQRMQSMTSMCGAGCAQAVVERATSQIYGVECALSTGNGERDGVVPLAMSRTAPAVHFPQSPLAQHLLVTPSRLRRRRSPRLDEVLPLQSWRWSCDGCGLIVWTVTDPTRRASAPSPRMSAREGVNFLQDVRFLGC
jgi:hypothetical protein